MEKEREFSDYLVRSTMISGVLRTGTLFPIPVQTCLEPAFVLFFYGLVEKAYATYFRPIQLNSCGPSNGRHIA